MESTQISVLDGMTPAEAAIHTLATNKDATMVAVAGARVLRLYSIDDGVFKEVHNLHQKRKQLNYGACDVAWNKFDENILATAPTNGVVVIWNLGASGKNKLDYSYNCHECVVNTVCFSHYDPFSLISCSNDGTCKLFDIRTREGAKLTFKYEDACSKIRDVQFSPLQPGFFASADENGMLLIWDTRSNGKPAYKTKAHTQPIYSIDYHPSSPFMMATGSRDRSIRVWDYKRERDKACYSLETSAPVRRIRWRPGKQWHLASCSLISDMSIHVWDITRPYIPFASFENHIDQPAGICWRSEKNPHLLLSLGKDGTLMQHVFKDASRPAEFASPVAIDIAHNGEITTAVGNHKSQLNPPSASPNGLSGIISKMRPVIDKQDDSLFRAPTTSTLRKITKTSSDSFMSYDWFITAARTYKISGASLGALCEHNAKVASDNNMHQIAQSWLILQTFYDFHPSCSNSQPVTHKNSSAAETQNSEGDIKSVGFDSKPGIVVNVSLETDEDQDVTLDCGRMLNGSGAIIQASSNLFGAASTDFFFGSAELMREISIEPSNANQTDNEWLLEKEAFEPKHLNIGVDEMSEDSGMTNGFSSHNISKCEYDSELVMKTPCLLDIPREQVKPPQWDSNPTVTKLLNFYVEQGDIQTSVSILLVLGEKGLKLIEQRLQETWYLSYIDLLERFELWSVSALIVKCCLLPEVSGLSNESTALALGCGKCNKSVLKCGWYCEICARLTQGCSVCNEPVHGLWSWCQQCGHGGHQSHVTQWFSLYKTCPTGCGHHCYPIK